MSTPINPGPALLRAAIAAAEITEAFAAREIFKVAPASLSDWLSGKTRPRPQYRAVALAWGKIPLEAWETPAERELRERALSLRPAPKKSKRPRSPRPKAA